MKEIVVLSGKGGTGKTSLTAALAAFCPDQVLVDCDVDGANLYLLLNPFVEQTHEFFGGAKAQVDPALCDSCGVCAELCRFDGIRVTDSGASVNELHCESCGVCEWNCPKQAISLSPVLCGHWYSSTTSYGRMVHAKLEPGQENSGRLVATVRREARELAEDTIASRILIDGPPGTGCPVISALTGTDYAVIVTEPTPSAFADFRRVANVADHFGVPVGVIVNKADIHKETADAIEAAARSDGRDILGRIDYLPAFVQAQLAATTVLKTGGSALREMVEGIHRRLAEAIDLRFSPLAVLR